MTRRLTLFLLVLLLAATPALARRRAVLFGAASHCVTGILENDAYAAAITSDATHIYWIDDGEASLRRVAKSGGPSQRLAFLENWIPFSLAVDATHVYLGVLPAEALFSPRPGSILSIPKSGGTLSVLISGVATPFDIETDATHLYWAAVGTVDFENETIAADGKIERALRNGSGRQVLAENLSTPTDLALDDDALWFGENGFAEGDPSVGLYVMPKSGGAITTIDELVAPSRITPVGAALVVWGARGAVDNGLFVIRKDRGGVRTLVDDEILASGAQVMDGVAYYLTESFDANVLWSVPVVGGTPVIVRDDVYFTDDFDVDACAITLSTVDGTLERVKR
jgi:hypothetical protein